MIDHTLLTIPDWNSPTNVLAFTTQVIGGVSRGSYQSLNVGLHVGDDQRHVELNRSVLPHNEKMYWLNQTHSDIAIRLPNSCVDADAAFTSNLDTACAVMTADCLPLLLTDLDGQIVCAIHAGWKGLKNHIISNTIKQAFVDVPPKNILAWIGPHIRQCHYEVDKILAAHFKHYNDAYIPTKHPEKVMLNLQSIATQQLSQVGIAQIFTNTECTYCETDKYFSFRRASHQGYENCGRMVSVIMKRK